MDKTIVIIVSCALATYATRIGGYFILSRFGTIHHRLEAALSAVPIAVLTALVAPSVVTHGPAEAFAIIISAAVAMRYSLMISIIAGLLSLVFLRTLIA